VHTPLEFALQGILLLQVFTCAKTRPKRVCPCHPVEEDLSYSALRAGPAAGPPFRLSRDLC